MIENELRETFARNEKHEIELGRLRSAIDRVAARRRRKRVTVRLSAVALAVVAAVIGVPMLKGVAEVKPIVDQIAGDPWPSRALNILMIGIDEASHSDNVTILQIPADRRKAYLVSIERDVLVDIPGHGKGKIGHTHVLGGLPLTEVVVSAMTGLTFDATVSVTGPGIGSLVDAMGGIEICLPWPAPSYHHRDRVYPAGCSKYTGAEVADLVRQRWGQPTGAYDRDRNNHRVFAGLAGAVKTDPASLIKLLNVDGIAIDTRGRSLLVLAEQLRGLKASAIVGIGQSAFRSRDLDGVSYQELDPTVAPALFAALRDGSLDQFVVKHPDWVTPIQR